MNFALLRSVRSLTIFTQSRVNQFNRFGTCTSLLNKSQDGNESKPSDSKPDDTLEVMRVFARQRQQQRGERGNRTEGAYGAINPKATNKKQSAEEGTQSPRKQSQPSYEALSESVSIFDRLTKKNVDGKEQTSHTRTEKQALGKARQKTHADTTPKTTDTNAQKKPVEEAPLKKIVFERQLPTHSRWIDKQREVGRSVFDESKKSARTSHSVAKQNKSTPSDAGTSQESTNSETNETDALYRSIQLEISGHDEAVLRSYAEFLRMSVHGLGIADSLERVWTTPRHFYRRTLLKSNFVHKLHRRQYEIRTYFLFARLVRLTGSTADTLLEYAQRNLPEGTAMKVSFERIEPLPSRILQSLGTLSQSASPNEAARETVQA